MAWTQDAPGGVYKNHALSKKIRMEATANSHFFKFATPEPGYGKGKGESITTTIIDELPLAGRVNETDRLPSNTPARSTLTHTVSEWGSKIPMTAYEVNINPFGLVDKYQDRLRSQMRLTMDYMTASAMKKTPVKAIGSGTSGVTFDTDGTASTAAGHNLTTADLAEIFDYMHGTLKVPPMSDGCYVGILSTKPARGIKSDAKFESWLAQYSGSPGIKTFETGMIAPKVQGFRLYETNHRDALDNSIGTSSVTGEAIFFGMDAVGSMVVEAPELRRSPSVDLDRFFEIGWVGTLEAFLPWTKADQARTVHWSSS